MRAKELFLLFFWPVFLIGDMAQPVISEPPPTWVKDTDFSLEPPSIHSSQVNEQTLLLNTQYHLERKTFFFHRAMKILTQKGVSDLSQLRFSFDPSYQSLIMHKIRIYREGKWSDRMTTSICKLVQRENELDSKLYNGDLCLVYFLDDIRVGDILDYSCSFIGENPIFPSHFAHVFSLQEKASIEKICRRVLGHPSQKLFAKSFNTEIKPTINALSPELQEWVWEVSSTEPDLEESDEPQWYNPTARVHVSQYKTWGEVVQKITPLYSIPKNLSKSCPAEVRELLKKWKKTAGNPIDRATLALRFVQDEIRYQGFEDGIGAFKPTDPWAVFKRRFGDCKDKSFLLLNLLKLLSIEATPVLVHSKYGKNLPDVLPNPFLFDHVVLRICVSGKWYWVDPTIQQQGGSLLENYFPNYHWGLVIAEATDELIPIPQVVLVKPIEIVTSISTKTPEVAEVSTEVTRYAEKADQFRKYVGTVGLQNISDEHLRGLKKKYGAVTILSPLSISDDRKNNIIISKESFNIPTKTRSGKKILKTNSFVLLNCLDDAITLDRSAPYALSYPLWVKERITIANPHATWPRESDEYHVENPSFYYSYISRFKNKNAEILHEIKHVKDHIPTELIDEYWNAVDEIKVRSIDEVNIVALRDGKISQNVSKFSADQ